MTEYTINELAQLSGINRRNIHFYVQQGLLPPPEGAGLAARYRDEHLLRLRAIPVLRNHGLRLDEIRAQLTGLDTPALEKLVAHPPALAPAPPPALRVMPAPGRPAPREQAVTRYILAPGVELLVDESADPATRTWVGELLRSLPVLLNRHGNSDLNSNGGHS